MNKYMRPLLLFFVSSSSYVFSYNQEYEYATIVAHLKDLHRKLKDHGTQMRLFSSQQYQAEIWKDKSILDTPDDLSTNFARTTLRLLQNQKCVNLATMDEEVYNKPENLDTWSSCVTRNPSLLLHPFFFKKINGHRCDRAERIDVRNAFNTPQTLYTLRTNGKCINTKKVATTVSLFYDFSRWQDDEDNVKYAALDPEVLVKVWLYNTYRKTFGLY